MAFLRITVVDPLIFERILVLDDGGDPLLKSEDGGMIFVMFWMLRQGDLPGCTMVCWIDWGYAF
jgi:hypothetical protein